MIEARFSAVSFKGATSFQQNSVFEPLRVRERLELQDRRSIPSLGRDSFWHPVLGHLMTDYRAEDCPSVTGGKKKTEKIYNTRGSNAWVDARGSISVSDL
jgi:hypothetical protein